MKILLDECIPIPFRRLLVGHECVTVAYMGWAGLKNGDLVRQAEAQVDLFVTADQNLRYQQNLAGRKVAVLELSTNNLRRLEAAGELIAKNIAEMRPGEFRVLQVP